MRRKRTATRGMGGGQGERSRGRSILAKGVIWTLIVAGVGLGLVSAVFGVRSRWCTDVVSWRSAWSTADSFALGSDHVEVWGVQAESAAGSLRVDVLWSDSATSMAFNDGWNWESGSGSGRGVSPFVSPSFLFRWNGFKNRENAYPGTDLDFHPATLLAVKWPWWLGFVAGAGMLLIGFIGRRRVWRRFRGKACCRYCGYDTGGLPSESRVCSECGRALSVDPEASRVLNNEGLA